MRSFLIYHVHLRSACAIVEHVHATYVGCLGVVFAILLAQVAAQGRSTFTTLIESKLCN